MKRLAIIGLICVFALSLLGLNSTSVNADFNDTDDPELVDPGN